MVERVEGCLSRQKYTLFIYVRYKNAEKRVQKQKNTPKMQKLYTFSHQL
jgi:L-rhamnose mutarotase